MFEKALAEKFRALFDVSIVRFESPGEDLEQEALFIQVDSAKCVIRDGMQSARVNGRVIMYAQAEKLPFGFFAKCIAQRPELCADVFFFELEENNRLYDNIVGRSFSFQYFFRSQYDPSVGSITSVNLEVEEQ